MPVRQPWVGRVERRLRRWIKQGLGKTWMVAVSGGGDSVGLLWVLHQLAEPLGVSLAVAHLDHGVRGEEARADAAFVEALAGSLGVPFVAGAWRPTRSGHFESDARRARYDWLIEAARTRGASVIAVGHTSDDQAETILHRIIRGTGLSGLAGIPARRELASNPPLTLVRPLLSISRQEVRELLASLDQPYREDASNADLSRTRARIRHDLLPKLADEYNPQVARALVRLGALASSAHAALADLCDIEESAVITRTADCVVLKHGYLQSIPFYQRTEVLRRVWRNAAWPERGMSAARWRRLARLVGRSKIPKLDVGACVEVSTEKSFIVLRRREPLPELQAVTDEFEPKLLAIPGLTSVPWGAGAIDARIELRPDNPPDETVDLDQIAPPVLVRSPSAGDRFEPLGMGGQSMALGDFLRGRHVNRADRRRVPLVCDQNGIIWVVGHRIADRVKIRRSTRRKLGLAWCPVEAGRHNPSHRLGCD
jgi:tRNA(Ile)-lysidine synthase